MKPTFFPQDQQWDEELIKTLKRLGSFESEYPAELLGARRAAFVELLEQYHAPEITEELYSEDREIIGLLSRLGSAKSTYPPNLMAARRAVFVRQLALRNRVSVLEVLRASVRNLKTLFSPTMNMMRTSLIVVALILMVFVGSVLSSREQDSNPAFSQGEASQPGVVFVATGTGEVAKVICKSGYLPPLCLAKEFDKSRDLTFPGNGAARPAVAKDTLPGYNGVHKPAYVNDGLYGPGASWISNSAYSWIKIDLGKTMAINTVAFGRDRLGNFNDRDPGQFVIAVAASDNVYADGNSSNDSLEYTEVYNSEQIGFDGVVSGPETIEAQFGPVMARFIKIVFANPGTAVDEVEVFMAEPSVLANDQTESPNEDLVGRPSTSMPTSTSVPTETATPIPTDTPVPPTATPIPTDTLIPTDTAIPIPTDTLIPPTVPPPTDTFLPPTEAVEPMVAPSETPVQVDEP